MALDPSVAAALRAAVAADPENLALRAHVAGSLLSGGLAEDALAEAQAILARRPDDVEGLRIAAESAAATGAHTQALAYRRMLDAIRMEGARNLLDDLPEPPIEPTPMRLADGDYDPFSEDFDDPEDGPGERGSLLKPVESDLTLADVAGLEVVKKRLQVSFLAPMRNPDLRKLYGKKLRGGLLLYGPPGCGKTFLARAIAGELGARFLSVGLTDVVDMYIGQSERNLREVFETARRAAPCVLFVDEIDALGRKRSQMREHAGRNTVNQLLSELDGVQNENEGLFVLAATNHPWDVDSALRRPGRLDRTLLVLPPDAPAREQIVRSALTDRPAESIDAGWIAAKTEDFSGADVAHLVETAAERALEDSVMTGKVRPIRMDDFRAALKEVRPSTRTWFETAKNFAIYGNEGGSYDDLVEFLRAKRMM